MQEERAIANNPGLLDSLTCETGKSKAKTFEIFWRGSPESGQYTSNRSLYAMQISEDFCKFWKAVLKSELHADEMVWVFEHKALPELSFP